MVTIKKEFQIAVKPTLDNRPYRLRCRFKIEPYPRLDRLDKEKVRVAERFVRDMKLQGWEYDNRHGFKMSGPFPMIEPTTIRVPLSLSAREMLPRLVQGERFLDLGVDTAKPMPQLNSSEWWEYELAGVFIRLAILTERPDAHEEEH